MQNWKSDWTGVFLNFAYPTNDELKSLEDSAVAFAIGAKDLLQKNLGNTNVKYKGDGFSNPVTNVDLEIEKYWYILSLFFI